MGEREGEGEYQVWIHHVIRHTHEHEVVMCIYSSTLERARRGVFMLSHLDRTTYHQTAAYISDTDSPYTDTSPERERERERERVCPL